MNLEMGKNPPKGVATLPTVIALTILILAVGILITSITTAENLSTDNLSGSSKALFYAQIGARDGLERVARNKNYSGNYSLNVEPGGCSAPFAGCVTVTVDTGTSPKIITAEGRVGNNYRRIRVSATLDANGLISGFSWQEL